MTHRTKFAATALAVASLGIAGGVADAATKTKLSISAEEEAFTGSLSSSKAKCEADRKVSLLQQKGKKQDPKKDKRVGSDLSNDDGDWTVKTGKEGKFYATVKANKSCTGATSKTVKSED